MFVVNCVRCGREICTESADSECPVCFTPFHIIWPGDDVKVTQPKTISEEYER